MTFHKRVLNQVVILYAWKTKALGKLGNIVAETLCFLSMFSCLPTLKNIVEETKFVSKEVEMFPKKFRSIFVAKTMFPSLPTSFQVFPAEETLFSLLGMSNSRLQCKHKQYIKIR